MKPENAEKSLARVLQVACCVAICGTAIAEDGVGSSPAPIITAPATPVVENDEAALDEVVTVGRFVSATQQLINERQDGEVVIDLLGDDMISRMGDSTVAAALRRLPGLSLVNDKFVYIRGLGERYSSTSLNGAVIPSPDLTRNVIPLDLFPTSIVRSLRVQKGYTADMGANFGGGHVDIRTKTIPDSFTMSLELGSGVNSETTGNVMTYPGGGDDWLGIDDGGRALSPQLLATIDAYQGNVDIQGILAAERASNPSTTLADAQLINRDMALQLNRSFELQETGADPDLDVQGSIGNSFNISDRVEFGFLAGASYGNSWRESTSISRDFNFPKERTNTKQESTRAVSVAGNLNLGLHVTDDHQLSTTTVYLRNTDNDTAVRDFFNENREISDGIGFRDYRFQFEQRDLVVNQVTGAHILGDDTRDLLPDTIAGLVDVIPRDASVTWFYSNARTRTDIPNQVNIEAQTTTDPVTAAVLSSAVTLDATAADFRFTDLDDEVINYGWKFTLPLQTGESYIELSTGYEYFQKARTYYQRQFGIGALSVGDPGVLQGPLSTVFSDENIMDSANNYVFDIRGTNNQSYLAATTTDAIFGKVDWTWNDTWRFAAGLRWEDYKQVALDVNPFGYTADDPVMTTDADYLQNAVFAGGSAYPSAALTYKSDWWAETFQLRFGWSRTTVRPDLREITDASYIDPLTDDLVDGNPGVIPADVHNYDLRAEWFFASGDNLTVSLFRKEIDNPIEFFESAASDTTVAREIINAQSAHVYGVEIEGLKELAFLGEQFDTLFLQGNVTVQDSELVAGPQADAPTNPIRKLTSASDYVANLMLGYDSHDGRHMAAVVYNVFGERLYVSGRNGAPDGYEQPLHSLDLTYAWYPTANLTVKAKVQNLLDESVRIEREGVTIFEEKPGMTFAVGFTWSM